MASPAQQMPEGDGTTLPAQPTTKVNRVASREKLMSEVGQVASQGAFMSDANQSTSQEKLKPEAGTALYIQSALPCDSEEDIVALFRCPEELTFAPCTGGYAILVPAGQRKPIMATLPSTPELPQSWRTCQEACF